MLKALIFDLGNVIVPFDFKRAYARLEPLCKLSIDDIRARLRSTSLVHRFETGLIDSERFVEEFSALLEFQISYPEFCQLWSSIFLPDALIPESLLAPLAGRYELLVLSNTNPIHFAMMQANYPILRHFHHFILSHQVRAAKPAAKIYQEAISQAGCAAQECFFADDLLINVEAAREQGMDAVQFESARQIENELRSRGVL
jgi:putative hydrolase of the HAD superfamily